MGYSPRGRKDTIERLTLTGWGCRGADLGYQQIKGQREAKDRESGSRGVVGGIGRNPQVPLGRKPSWPHRTTGDEATGTRVSCFQKQEQTLNSEAEYE